MTHKPLHNLLINQNPDGGWGYAPGDDSVVEVTSAVSLAIANHPEAEAAVSNSLKWLITNQNLDGGWGITSSDGRSGWQTAWAVLALSQLSENLSNLYRGVNWLIRVEIAEINRETDKQMIRDMFSFDPNLRGWPWQPGEATFVEPTTIAMLALSSVENSRPILARINEGINYLHDRRCAEGGWNVGNPEMFSKNLPPRAHPTAWGILALDQAAPEEILQQDIDALREQISIDGGPLAIAWGILALRSQHLDDTAERAKLESLSLSNGSWDDNPYTTATAMMAIDENFTFPGIHHG
jgi:hypothetical protein